MNRLEKLKHHTINKLESYNHAAEVFHPASYYDGADKGWELASFEYEKIIAELEGALKFAESYNPQEDYGHILNEVRISSYEALQKLKEFKND